MVMLATYPFAVDRNLVVRIDAKRSDLGDVSGALHVRGVATSTKDDCDLCLGLRIVRRDQRAGGVAGQRDDLSRDVLYGIEEL